MYMKIQLIYVVVKFSGAPHCVHCRLYAPLLYKLTTPKAIRSTVTITIFVFELKFKQFCRKLGKFCAKRTKVRILYSAWHSLHNNKQYCARVLCSIAVKQWTSTLTTPPTLLIRMKPTRRQHQQYNSAAFYTDEYAFS